MLVLFLIVSIKCIYPSYTINGPLVFSSLPPFTLLNETNITSPPVSFNFGDQVLSSCSNYCNEYDLCVGFLSSSSQCFFLQDLTPFIRSYSQMKIKPAGSGRGYGVHVRPNILSYIPIIINNSQFLPNFYQILTTNAHFIEPTTSNEKLSFIQNNTNFFFNTQYPFSLSHLRIDYDISDEINPIYVYLNLNNYEKTFVLDSNKGSNILSLNGYYESGHIQLDLNVDNVKISFIGASVNDGLSADNQDLQIKSTNKNNKILFSTENQLQTTVKTSEFCALFTSIGLLTNYTVNMVDSKYDYLKDIVYNGGNIPLFQSIKNLTKTQSKNVQEEPANYINMNNGSILDPSLLRWLDRKETVKQIDGLNNQSIYQQIRKLKQDLKKTPNLPSSSITNLGHINPPEKYVNNNVIFSSLLSIKSNFLRKLNFKHNYCSKLVDNNYCLDRILFASVKYSNLC